MRKRLLFVALLSVLTVSPNFTVHAAAGDSKVIAYYFHGNMRCYSCNVLEQYSKEAIEGNFKNELENGNLVFKTVNVQERANNHFMQDYGLYSQSLVLSLVENGKEKKFKNLTMIWQYARDRERFFNYVKNEVDSYLKELS